MGDFNFHLCGYCRKSTKKYVLYLKQKKKFVVVVVLSQINQHIQETEWKQYTTLSWPRVPWAKFYSGCHIVKSAKIQDVCTCDVSCTIPIGCLLVQRSLQPGGSLAERGIQAKGRKKEEEGGGEGKAKGVEGWECYTDWGAPRMIRTERVQKQAYPEALE